MPTQMLSRAEIVRRWGPLLPGFEPAPPGHPIAGGMPAGAVTDDTEQAVLLARLLVKGRGTIDPHELAAALTEWERAMAERGSLDLLGPSTKRAVAAILAGVPPEEAGAAGTTNGAAMRIAPVGIAVPVALHDPTPEAQIVDPGRPRSDGEQCHAQHRHRAGRGRGRGRRGERGCLRRHGRRGHGAGHPGRAPRGRPRALGGRRGRRGPHRVGHRPGRGPGRRGAGAEAEAAGLIYTLVGTSLATQESVPAAFAVLAAVPADPWRACRLAASLGGDCDTIAAMTGAIAGACHGAGSFPPEAIAAIDAQGLGLAALAGELLALRDRHGNEAP